MSRNDERVKYRRAEASGFQQGGSLPIAALTDHSVGLFQPCVSLLPISLETGSVLDPLFQKRGLRTHWLSGLYRAGYLPNLDAECNPVYNEPIPITYEDETDRVHEIIDGTIVYVGPYDASCPCHEAGVRQVEGRTAA